MPSPIPVRRGATPSESDRRTFYSLLLNIAPFLFLLFRSVSRTLLKKKKDRFLEQHHKYWYQNDDPQVMNTTDNSLFFSPRGEDVFSPGKRVPSGRASTRNYSS